MDELRGVAQPRLEKLAEHCKFDATPTDDADGKSVLLNFKTPVAHVSGCASRPLTTRRSAISC